MGELDDLLRKAQTQPRRVTLTVTNPTDREMRRLRQQAQTINSYKAPGLQRARLEET